MNKKISKKIKLGVLGPLYTNSDLAADFHQQKEKKKYEKIYFPTITDIFEAVKKGKIERAIVPLKNNQTGKIEETSQFLEEKAFKITKKFSFPIHYSLVVLPGVDKENVQAVGSHQQALQQCKKYLKENFPFTIKKKYASTMAALQKMIEKKERNFAAIIPSKAAKKFQVEMLEEGIEDHKKNQTIFVVIKKNKS